MIDSMCWWEFWVDKTGESTAIKQDWETHDQLNPFHNQLKFTHDDLNSSSDIHFLDLKITSYGLSIHGKASHSGQYSIHPSFQLWHYKTALIQSLVNRAKRLCSDTNLLKFELNEIKKIWIIDQFPKDCHEQDNQQLCVQSNPKPRKSRCYCFQNLPHPIHCQIH